jgi:ABC-2 type transport system ATP-binding protein
VSGGVGASPLESAGAGAPADTRPIAVELRGVEKRFGSLIAVRELSLAIPQGSVYGFIGPNGAGKTTTIRMIMDIIAPDRGEVRFLGAPRTRESAARTGYLPEERGLYPKMKIGWTLEYLARLKGMTDRRHLRREVDRWLDRMNLLARKHDKVEALSKGNQQKVQFVATVIHDPELIILDEPFSGLDPVNAQLLSDIIAELKARGRTVIFSTHVMEQAEKLCESVFMIARGDKVLDGRLDEIKRRFGTGSFVVELDGASGANGASGASGAGAAPDAAPDGGAPDGGAPDGGAAFLRGLACVERVEPRREGARAAHEVFLRETAGLGELLRGLADGPRLRRVERLEPTLHAIFVKLAGPGAEAASGSGVDGQGPGDDASAAEAAA